MTITTPLATPGRVRTAWRRAHDPVYGVPRWACIAAYTIPFVVLPSSIWRIVTFAFHVPLVDKAPPGADINGTLPGWFPLEVYVILLSLVSEALAFLAIGLIARWGEVFPRRIPGLGGRRVPVVGAVVPAVLGSAILTVLWTWTAATAAVGRTVQGEAVTADNPFAQYDWHFVVAAVAYVPLIAWGPLLAAVTVAYYRRRRS
ncbi:MAG: hypothetical protein L0K86_12345 [Actinomycetia bacterium]|nr:hypothetical protein [Actinomycetes bacterium]